MDILDKIVATKKVEVAKAKQVVPVQRLEESEFFDRAVHSMSAALIEKSPSSIIAEFKRRSPSKGNIFHEAEVHKVIPEYVEAGCAGISVLTDSTYFGGSLKDLKDARALAPNTPFLRKEFIIDEYQVIEAKSAGADLILLIAEVLTAGQVRALSKVAKMLGLEVLLEMHSREQLGKLVKDVDIVGINNRDLKTFTVDLKASIQLLGELKGEYLKISESGLSDPATVAMLRREGFEGFLVGESFMKTHAPGVACTSFINGINEALSV